VSAVQQTQASARIMGGSCSSGSLAMFTAIRRASSFVSTLACRDPDCSKLHRLN
jgi:hypothetical protein